MAHWQIEAQDGRNVLLAESFIINDVVNAVLTIRVQGVEAEMTEFQMKQIETNKNIRHGIICMVI